VFIAAPDDLVDQRGLADAGLSRDDDDAVVAGADVLKQLVDEANLRIASNQRSSRPNWVVRLGNAPDCRFEVAPSCSGSVTRAALVIGGQGVLGSFIARDLTAAGWQVTRAGRRPENAPDFRLVDLDDPANVLEACAVVDLVVNAVHHPELVPERTVLRDGGTLINLTDLTEAERAQLARAGAEGRGLVVADTGFSGIAYLAIAELLREHPEADAAEYSLMFSASGSAGRAGALFAHRLLTASAHHGSTTVPLPEPFGESRCLEVGAGDAGLRKRIGDVPLRHFLCMQPSALQRLLLTLNRARLIGLMPAALFTTGSGAVPAELTEEPICEWVAVSRDGRRLAARTLGGRGYYRITSAATVAFADALLESARFDDRKEGLHSIDELLTLEDIRAAVEGHGIAVQPLDAVASAA
jgi:NAD(P)-dependent dehydrogenase (short-subunit alcohol dehydrogenase family)